MDSASENKQEIDVKLLGLHLRDEHTRRYALPYPPNLHIITTAASKVIHQLEKLLVSRPDVTLVIDR